MKYVVFGKDRTGTIVSGLILAIVLSLMTLTSYVIIKARPKHNMACCSSDVCAREGHHR